jgi:hypothetical protein
VNKVWWCYNAIINNNSLLIINHIVSHTLYSLTLIALPLAFPGPLWFHLGQPTSSWPWECQALLLGHVYEICLDSVHAQTFSFSCHSWSYIKYTLHATRANILNSYYWNQITNWKCDRVNFPMSRLCLMWSRKLEGACK